MSGVVREDSVIRLGYRLALKDGEVLDKTDDGGELIALDTGEFADALEALLVGLRVGDKKEFPISAEEEIFGAWDPENIQLLDRASLGSEVPLEAGQVVEFETPEGPVAALITDLDDETVTVDFNHPLCQHDLVFSVEILAIEGS